MQKKKEQNLYTYIYIYENYFFKGWIENDDMPLMQLNRSIIIINAMLQFIYIYIYILAPKNALA